MRQQQERTVSMFASYFHQRVALADLGTGNCYVQPLEEDLIFSALSSADGSGLAGALAALYPVGLVLAAGPLGGSFAPGSGLLTLAAEQKGKRELAFVPQGHGAWLRASGLDALIITGVASSPMLLRVSGGTCRMEPAPVSAPHTGRNALRQALLQRTETGQAALLLGDCAFERRTRPAFAAGLENGSMESGAFVAALLDYRNLAAVMLEGRGPLPPMPLPLRNQARTVCTTREPSFLRELAQYGVASPPRKLRWKSAACLHCPSPCLAWIRVEENQWLLCGDHAGAAAALLACGDSAPACLALCDELGLDVATYAPLLSGIAPEALREAVQHLPEAPEALDQQPALPETPDAPRMRAGASLGLCPKLLRRYPSLTLHMQAGLLEGEARTLLLQNA